MSNPNNEGPSSAPGPSAASPPASPPGGKSRVRWWVALAVAVPLVLLAVVATTGLSRPDAGATTGAELAPGSEGAFPDGSDQLAVGDLVPRFTVPTLSGVAFRMPNGTPTVLTFVDLCPTCIAGTRTIAELQERFADVAVLAIASDPTADRAALEEFVGEAGGQGFELALDPQNTLTARFDAFSMSASVLVVDRDGAIVYRGPVAEQPMTDALMAAGAQG